MQVFIGVAWPYAAGPRHLGHLAGAYLPADIVARYHRLAGDEVLMVSGSDQHGTPITVAAEAAGEPPAAFAERQHEAIRTSFQAVGISFDHYSRTASPNHHRIVQEVFTDLSRGGWVSEAVAEAAFCPAEGRSLPDRYVIGVCPHCRYSDARGDQCDHCGRTLDPDELTSPRCRRCGRAAAFVPLRQLFLGLDELQPSIAPWVRSVAPSWRRFVAEETAGLLAQGLRARAITRDLDWGVPVPLPGWDDRRLYVWFDAVIGYLSASQEWAAERGDPEGWRKWWEDPQAQHRYFIGKDNLFFHTLFWPAILAGTGRDWHLPDDVVVNHHLTMSGAQMSSSRGHGFELDEAVARRGVDPLRHALAAQNPESADTEFSFEAAAEATRTGLLGSIANPAYRVASLLWQRSGGRLDASAWAAAGAERARAAELLAEIGQSIRQARLRHGLSLVHQLGRTVNQRLAETEPWKLPDADAGRALAPLFPYLDALGTAAWPYVPDTAGAIRTLLGRSARPSSWTLDPTVPVVGSCPQPPLPERR